MKHWLKCPVCKDPFRTHTALTNHIKKAHPDYAQRLGK